MSFVLEAYTMEQQGNEKYISMKEVCEYLSVQRQTVLNWIAQKNFPAVKVGKFWRFKLSEIEDWIKTQNESE